MQPSPLVSVEKQNFLSLADHSPETIHHLLELTHTLYQKESHHLQRKTVAMLFDKPSTRTRVSFEVAIRQLGGAPLLLQRNELQLGRGESLADTAKVLSRYIDALVIRTPDHSVVQELAGHASIPIINGLTDQAHPCQTMADLFTLQQLKGNLTGVKLAYIGDGNNVLSSLMQGAASVGMELAISTPDRYQPSAQVWEQAEHIATHTGAKLSFYTQPEEAIKEADAVYTDVWVSMGQEKEKETKQEHFGGFTVTKEKMKWAKPDAVFMHCLPAYRGLEVESEVIDGPQSVVLQQAENRLHVQKAILSYLLA